MDDASAAEIKVWFLEHHQDQMREIAAFREAWNGGHATVTAEVSRLKDQVAQQNGNVSSALRQIGQISTELAKHVADCPLRAFCTRPS